MPAEFGQIDKAHLAYLANRTPVMAGENRTLRVGLARFNRRRLD
jgi:hypothetical protein